MGMSGIPISSRGSNRLSPNARTSSSGMATSPRLSANSYVAGCDCYVSLHRSEGFGLTMAEAMACGKPVIATGYSGNLEFMTEDEQLPRAVSTRRHAGKVVGICAGRAVGRAERRSRLRG